MTTARGPTCSHRGEAVKVGPYQVLAGGTQYLQPGDFNAADVVIPLGQPGCYGEDGNYDILTMPLADFGGVPDDWRQQLESTVIPLLTAGKRVLVFCTASHGRTGTFLASLIALLESETETPDPIAAVRQRHCPHAVETRLQARAVFALRGRPVPDQYSQLY